MDIGTAFLLGVLVGQWVVALRHLASAQQVGRIDFRRRNTLYVTPQQRHYRLQTAP